MYGRIMTPYPVFVKYIIASYEEGCPHSGRGGRVGRFSPPLSRRGARAAGGVVGLVGFPLLSRGGVPAQRAGWSGWSVFPSSLEEGCPRSGRGGRGLRPHLVRQLSSRTSVDR